MKRLGQILHSPTDLSRRGNPQLRLQLKTAPWQRCQTCFRYFILMTSSERRATHFLMPGGMPGPVTGSPAASRGYLSGLIDMLSYQTALDGNGAKATCVTTPITAVAKIGRGAISMRRSTRSPTKSRKQF
jgi:hypothetical protein